MNQYLKYILRGFLTMLGAVLAVIMVFVLIQFFINSPLKNSDSSAEILEPGVNTELSKDVTSSAISDVSQTEGVYLRDLPLSNAQKSAASTVGIDVDTYYISPETMKCAQIKLGTSRYAEIVGGDAPSFMESTKLIQCL